MEKIGGFCFVMIRICRYFALGFESDLSLDSPNDTVISMASFTSIRVLSENA